MSVLNEVKNQFKVGNNLTRIIIINVAVFVLLNLVNLLSWILFRGPSEQSPLFSFFFDNLVTNLNPNYLIEKPWTVFTYMFTHKGFFHLFSNMLLLFWMGRIFLDLLNGKRFVAIYLLGGISGFLFSLLAYKYLPGISLDSLSQSSMPLLGASGAVTAIVVAISTYVPEYEIFMLFLGRVKLKYFAIVIVALDILLLPMGNEGGRLTHLGGALFGFLWATQMKRNVDISKWFMSIMDKIVTWFKPRKTNMKVSYKQPSSSKSAFGKKASTTSKASYVDYEEVKDTVSQEQKDLDAILDKIAKSGYESLTAQEKEKLFSASNKNK